jgi:hypothetical protein
MLLEEAYEAAERPKCAHDPGEFKIDDEEMAETARRDLDRIFITAGIGLKAALARQARNLQAVS